jgi:hypothetical protein
VPCLARRNVALQQPRRASGTARRIDPARIVDSRPPSVAGSESPWRFEARSVSRPQSPSGNIPSAPAAGVSPLKHCPSRTVQIPSRHGRDRARHGAGCRGDQTATTLRFRTIIPSRPKTWVVWAMWIVPIIPPKTGWENCPTHFHGTVCATGKRQES